LSLVLRSVVFILMLAAPLSRAATVWNGPLVTFSQPTPDPTQVSNQDRITPDVWLTRAASKGIFNAFSETNATALSPANTEWSLGTLTNYASLHYTNWLAWLNGQSPTMLVGKQVVAHLISDDIYISINFTLWNAGGSGGFAYQRSTPPLETASITSPGGGAVFAAPATVNIVVNAIASSGMVTNVEFFTNGVSLGTVLTAPFTIQASNLAAGPYALIAVATAAGISTTSAVVNVSVVTPVTVNLSNSALAVNNSQFTFNYNVDPGLAYVVQSSSDLLNWVSLATNVPTASPASFSDTFNPAGANYYRVGLLPNP
jgi:hypothetical protein